MFRKLLFAAAIALTPPALSETASADHNCYRGYGYGGPVVYGGRYGYRGYHRPYYPRYRSGYISVGRGFYGYPYGGLYGGGLYGGGFGYGYPLYYGRGAVGIQRGGFGLQIGW